MPLVYKLFFVRGVVFNLTKTVSLPEFYIEQVHLEISSITVERKFADRDGNNQRDTLGVLNMACLLTTVSY